MKLWERGPNPAHDNWKVGPNYTERADLASAALGELEIPHQVLPSGGETWECRFECNGERLGTPSFDSEALALACALFIVTGMNSQH